MSETRLGQPVCLDCDEVYVGEGPICGRCEQGKEPESCPTCATLRTELEKVRGEREAWAKYRKEVLHSIRDGMGAGSKRVQKCCRIALKTAHRQARRVPLPQPPRVGRTGE